ncbi:hypothetical protein C7388_1237 [Methylobacterium radiotolerans]|nr:MULTISPECIES: hypothetical protein [Methylobacterium]MDE3750126.1 hypothetical protein [Methylobacterium radiotolerans]PVY95773.1 hypothetical protein C7388_1237 [Methylobacterium organophilum]
MQWNKPKYTFLCGYASGGEASVLATLKHIIHKFLEVFFSKPSLIVKAAVRFKPFPFVDVLAWRHIIQAPRLLK